MFLKILLSFFRNISADVIVDQVLFDRQNFLKNLLILKRSVFDFNPFLFRKFAKQIPAYILFTKRSFNHGLAVSLSNVIWKNIFQSTSFCSESSPSKCRTWFRF